MKKAITILVSLLALSTLTAQANATKYDFIAEHNSKPVRMCIAAASNDVQKLKKAIMLFERGDKRATANHYDCNGMSIANFAYNFKAYENAEFLNKYSSRINKVSNTKVEIHEVASTSSETIINIIVVAAP